MKCEACGREGAVFMGSSKSWGPDESDAENTPDNLPGGMAWVCEECIMGMVVAMHIMMESTPKPTAVCEKCGGYIDLEGHCINADCDRYPFGYTREDHHE